MARVWKDRVLDTTTTTGTGTLTLAGAVTGFAAASAVGDGNGAYWCVYAVDAGGSPTGDWEVFDGTYTAGGTTLSRASVLDSSNGGSAVSFAAGTKRVALVSPAGRSLLSVGGLTAGRVPFATTDGVVTDAAALAFNSGTGTLSATAFSGDGSGLTALNGSNVSSGTVAIGRLPTGTSGAALAVLNGANTWSTTQTLTVAPVFTDQSGSRTALGLGTAATQATGTSGATLPFANGTNTWANTQTFTVAPVFTAQANTRTALGLGTAATVATGTSGATIPLLNGTNTWSGSNTFNGGLSAKNPLFSDSVGGSLASFNDSQIIFYQSPTAGGSAVFTGNGSGLTSLDAGNISSGSLAAARVASNTLVAAKLSASTTNVLFGRSTAGAGAGEEIVCTSTGRSILDDTSTGAVRTTIGATTVGSNLFTLTNPSAIRFIKINADNTVTAESAATYQTSLGLGTAATASTGTSGSVVPLLSGANTFSAAQTVTVTDTANSTFTTALSLSHRVSNSPLAGLGTTLAFLGQTSTTPDTLIGELLFNFSDVTHLTRQGRARFTTYFGGTQAVCLELTSASAGVASIGFLGAVGVPRQSGDVGSALTTNGLMSGTPTFAGANLTGRVYNNYILLQDQKASSTNGGSASAATTVTRTLNTEVLDTGGHCTLSSNQFTLTAGTYLARIAVPAYAVGRHVAYLYNATAAATLLTSPPAYASTNDGQTHAVIFNRFTVAASQALEVRHYTQVASATFGQGVGSNIGTEVFTEVWLMKEAS